MYKVMVDSPEIRLNLQLGDIVQFDAPTDEDLNNKQFIIQYLDNGRMIIVGKDNIVKIINAHKVNNPDVTGAGDTVISTLSLAYTKYNDIVKAAEVANAAASIVVGKKGTATTSTAEIQSLLGE